MTRNEIATLEVIFTTEIADEAMPVLLVIKDIHGFVCEWAEQDSDLRPPLCKRGALTN